MMIKCLSALLIRLVTARRKLLNALKSFYFRQVLRELGPGALIYGRLLVYFPERITIGSNVTINDGVILGGRGGITIGNHVRISPHSIIESAYLDVSGPVPYEHCAKPVVIEDDVWIASRVCILAGVTVGKGAVAAAGAVVAKDVPPHHIAKGIPARCEPLERN